MVGQVLRMPWCWPLEFFSVPPTTALRVSLSPAPPTVGGAIEMAAGTELTLTIDGTLHLATQNHRIMRAGLSVLTFLQQSYVCVFFYFFIYFIYLFIFLKKNIWKNNLLFFCCHFSETGLVSASEEPTSESTALFCLSHSGQLLPVTSTYVEAVVSNSSFSASVVVKPPATGATAAATSFLVFCFVLFLFILFYLFLFIYLLLFFIFFCFCFVFCLVFFATHTDMTS